MTTPDATPKHHFYGDWAEWWPLVSPVADYTEEAAYCARVLGTAARAVETVLELGSGGGHIAAHLKQHFRLTLVDLSDDMLNVSRRSIPSVSTSRTTCALCASTGNSTRSSFTTPSST